MSCSSLGPTKVRPLRARWSCTLRLLRCIQATNPECMQHPGRCDTSVPLYSAYTHLSLMLIAACAARQSEKFASATWMLSVLQDSMHSGHPVSGASTFNRKCHMSRNAGTEQPWLQPLSMRKPSARWDEYRNTLRAHSTGMMGLHSGRWNPRWTSNSLRETGKHKVWRAHRNRLRIVSMKRTCLSNVTGTRFLPVSCTAYATQNERLRGQVQGRAAAM